MPLARAYVIIEQVPIVGQLDGLVNVRKLRVGGGVDLTQEREGDSSCHCVHNYENLFIYL